MQCECSAENCHNKVMAKGLCSKHYSQLRRHGKIFKYSSKDKNNEICARALIDLDDVDKVKNIKWHRSDLQRSNYYC